jgi:hypothetical protein
LFAALDYDPCVTRTIVGVDCHERVGIGGHRVNGVQIVIEVTMPSPPRYPSGGFQSARTTASTTNACLNGAANHIVFTPRPDLKFVEDIDSYLRPPRQKIGFLGMTHEATVFYVGKHHPIASGLRHCFQLTPRLLIYGTH